MKIMANVVVAQFAGAVERIRRRVEEAVARDARHSKPKDQPSIAEPRR